MKIAGRFQAWRHPKDPRRKRDKSGGGRAGQDAHPLSDKHFGRRHVEKAFDEAIFTEGVSRPGLSVSRPPKDNKSQSQRQKAPPTVDVGQFAEALVRFASVRFSRVAAPESDESLGVRESTSMPLSRVSAVSCRGRPPGGRTCTTLGGESCGRIQCRGCLSGANQGAAGVQRLPTAWPGWSGAAQTRRVGLRAHDHTPRV